MESEARLAIKEIGGKREVHGAWEEQGRQARTTSREVPCTICKMAPAFQASGKGERKQEERIHAP